MSDPVTGRYPFPSTADNGRYPCSSATASSYPISVRNTANPCQNDNLAPPPLIRSNVVLFFIIVASIAMLASVLFCWFVLPHTHLPEYTLHSFSQSGFNISAQHRLSATWNASLHVANPNKDMMIDYNRVIAYVFHKDSCLAESRVPPFHQGKGDAQTVLDVDLAVVNSYVDQTVLYAIDGENAAGEMKLNLKLYADFNPYSGNPDDREGKDFLKIWCSNIRISSSSGTMIGGPMNCRVKQYDGPIDAPDC